VSSLERVLLAVVEERASQDSRFGQQDHEDLIWGSLLAEELGEVHKAVNDYMFKGAPHRDVRMELVQVAAVAVAWVEAIDRRHTPGREIVGHEGEVS
jgi:NTP pyrophosphatase (non-canonical NTP hydrolase)